MILCIHYVVSQKKIEQGDKHVTPRYVIGQLAIFLCQYFASVYFVIDCRRKFS